MRPSRSLRRDLRRPRKPAESPVEALHLTVRSYNSLKRADIHTVGELISRSEQDLLDIRNFGSKSIDEVKLKLAEMGMALKDLPPDLDTRYAAPKPQRRPPMGVARHQIAALESWAQTTDRTARTAAAREGMQAKFEREVDPDGAMDPVTKAKAVEAHRKAYYLRLAQASAASRRKAS